MDLPYHSIGFYFTFDLNFLILKGIGLHHVDSHQYLWDNQKRKDELCLIQYCISGEGALEVDGILYKILPGQAFIIDIPGKSSYYLPSHSSCWEVLYLEFSKECLPLIRKIYRHTGPVLEISPQSGLAKRMLGIHKKALANELHTFFENAKIAHNLWMDLTAYALSLPCAKTSKIDKVKAYIDQNYYMSDLSLDLLADYAGMSKYYLCKKFHKKYGISPGKYLKELRISQSCRLLTTKTDYTISDIARMVGYANDNYFGKVFKACKKTTPDRFKKQSTHYDFIRAVYENPHVIPVEEENEEET